MVSGEELHIIVKRSIHQGRIWSAQPQLLLDDGPDELVTLSIPGSTCHLPRNSHDMHHVRESFRSGEWTLEASSGAQFVGVCRHRPDRYFNVTHLFAPESGEFLCWYVNFERPISRHSDGLVIDTLDLWLDLIVLPDGNTFWKDTDHWNWAGEQRLFSPGEVRRVEALRDELQTAARKGVEPFDGSWTEWVPIELDPLDPPPYWDRPPAVVDAREAFDRA